MRIAICVEYDGSRFCGWQVQTGQPSVQEHLETAISAVADHEVTIHGAGRTDAGVHACGQMAHFDSPSNRSSHSWTMGANSGLLEGISVLWAHRVDASFHARFSAESRSYRYVILNRPVRPAYLSGRVSWIPRHLDEAKMRAGAAHLVGTHDFSAFRSAHCSNKVPVKHVSEMSINRKGDWVWIDIQANGFLHNMVRIIAGTLIAVGVGDRSIDWVGDVLQGLDRTRAGATSTPDGLYFVSASYPGQYGLPSSPAACRYW